MAKPGKRSEFSAEEVQRMRDAVADGVSMVDVGRRFGIGSTKVSKLIRGAFLKLETRSGTTSLRVESEEAQAQMIQRLRELS